MEMRRLGRLEHQSSVIIYGAAALGDVTQDDADRSIQQALDGGINHFDVAASYGDAELRLGPWMSQIRDRIFLATKTGQRDRDSAWGRSTPRWSGCRPTRWTCCSCTPSATSTELDAATGPAGRSRRRSERRRRDWSARSASPATARGASNAPGSVAPLPVRDGADATERGALARRVVRAAYEALVEEVRRQDAGLMTIKTVSRRNWPDGADQPHATWYEPLTTRPASRRPSPGCSPRGGDGHPDRRGCRTARHGAGGRGNRMPLAEAEQLLAGVGGYSSPFISCRSDCAWGSARAASRVGKQADQVPRPRSRGVHRDLQ